MDRELTRLRPLAVQVGDVHQILSSSDVSLLVEGIGRLIEGMVKSHAGVAARPEVPGVLQSTIAALHELQESLVKSSGSLADPPFQPDRSEARLLRSVLADITGYQRGDLTPGLRQLRQLLDQ